MIPQEIKDKIVVRSSELFSIPKPGDYPPNIIKQVAKEMGMMAGCYEEAAAYGYSLAAEQLAEKDKLINDLKMENMTHEYNQAEAERFRPEYERQLLEEKESQIKELEEALKKIENPLEWLQKNLKDTESLNGINAITLSNNANYLKLIASQALNKHKNQ